MIISIILLAILCFWHIGFGSVKAYDNYISKNRTDSIRGIFILIVFLSHIKEYILEAGYVYDGIGDMIFSLFFSCLGQLMVVMFLFYSGFGITESILSKGINYVNSIPKHRVLSILINFDVAVCIFAIINWLIGNTFSLQKFILSLLCWDSLGNSNWYIFSIIVCYLMTWVVAKDGRKSMATVWGGVFALLIFVQLGLSIVKESHWYNTLWAYPMGMLWSIRRKDIEELVNRRYAEVVLVLLGALILSYFIIPNAAGLKLNMMSVFFSCLIITLTMRIKIDNPILRWCGQHLFPLYIYQRIPMLVLATLYPQLAADTPMLYIALCLTITVVIAYCYKFIKITV